jgi:hypothetical protein
VVVRATRGSSHLPRYDAPHPPHLNPSVDDRAPAPPPPPPPPVLASPSSSKNWGRHLKFALAGMVMAAGAYTRPLFGST